MGCTAQQGKFMMTSSNGNIFRVTGPLCGEVPVTGEFPSQRPVTQRFDVFFDLRLNKRLGKQSPGWWFETPSWSLWRHSNAPLGVRNYIITPGNISMVRMQTFLIMWSLKVTACTPIVERKCGHFDEIVINDCAGSCHLTSFGEASEQNFVNITILFRIYA